MIGDGEEAKRQPKRQENPALSPQQWRWIDAMIRFGNTPEAYKLAYPDDPSSRRRAGRLRRVAGNRTFQDELQKRRLALVDEDKHVRMLNIIIDADIRDYVDKRGRLRTDLPKWKMAAVQSVGEDGAKVQLYNRASAIKDLESINARRKAESSSQAEPWKVELVEMLDNVPRRAVEALARVLAKGSGLRGEESARFLSRLEEMA